MVDTPRYGHAPVPMRRVSEFGDVDNVGDFFWQDSDGERRIAMALPSPTDAAPGNYVLVVLRVAGEKIPGSPVWSWDGNEDRPTLTPSVHTVGHWHGWIRAGEMVEA